MRHHNPIDLRPLPEPRPSAPDEIAETVFRARAAQPQWEALGFEARARLLKIAGRRMLERRQEALELLRDEAGKSLGDMLLSEAIGPLQYVKDWIRIARPLLKPRRLGISPLAFPGKSGVIELLPRGVVAVIAPWNFPLANFFKPVFPALLCGNSVVLKPSEYAPQTASWFAGILNEVLPPGVLGVVQGDGKAGEALVRSGVDAVTFTGSSSTGKEVARLTAEQLIPCSVELGGKDAAIVLADCDLDRTVAGIMHWSLQNAGQACGGIERVYIEEELADRFVERLASAISRLRVASGENQSWDLGPLVNARQLTVVQEHVADALQKGARLVCGGIRVGKGYSFAPTILDRCDHSMKVLTEPTFGPVIPVVRVRNGKEAVALANACEYGLNASVWSRDPRKATWIARRLQVGTAFINNHAFTGAIPAAPWTGVRKSGYGVANSAFALNHYTRPRTLVTDRKRTADAWWLPMDSIAEELGQCLAEAQLGKIAPALKIPGLIRRREKGVLRFARGQVERPGRQKRAPSLGAFSRTGQWLLQSGRQVVPALSQRELDWGHAAIEAIFSGAPADELGPLPSGEVRDFLQDYHRQLPFQASLALRASFWIAGWSPLLQLKAWATLDRLPIPGRLEILGGMAASDSYLQRQLALLLKAPGAMSQLSTTRFVRALEAYRRPGSRKDVAA